MNKDCVNIANINTDHLFIKKNEHNKVMLLLYIPYEL